MHAWSANSCRRYIIRLTPSRAHVCTHLAGNPGSAASCRSVAVTSSLCFSVLLVPGFSCCPFSFLFIYLFFCPPPLPVCLCSSPRGFVPSLCTHEVAHLALSKFAELVEGDSRASLPFHFSLQRHNTEQRNCSDKQPSSSVRLFNAGWQYAITLSCFD